jgi:hypothetical protein
MGAGGLLRSKGPVLGASGSGGRALAVFAGLARLAADPAGATVVFVGEEIGAGSSTAVAELTVGEAGAELPIVVAVADSVIAGVDDAEGVGGAGVSFIEAGPGGRPAGARIDAGPLFAGQALSAGVTAAPAVRDVAGPGGPSDAVPAATGAGFPVRSAAAGPGHLPLTASRCAMPRQAVEPLLAARATAPAIGAIGVQVDAALAAAGPDRAIRLGTATAGTAVGGAGGGHAGAVQTG